MASMSSGDMLKLRTSNQSRPQPRKPFILASNRGQCALIFKLKLSVCSATVWKQQQRPTKNSALLTFPQLLRCRNFVWQMASFATTHGLYGTQVRGTALRLFSPLAVGSRPRQSCIFWPSKNASLAITALGHFPNFAKWSISKQGERELSSVDPTTTALLPS